MDDAFEFEIFGCEDCRLSFDTLDEFEYHVKMVHGLGVEIEVDL